jgi:ribosomal protein S26
MLEMLSEDTLICAFCEGYIADKIDYTKTQYCVPCNEYKGVTTVREYKEMWS